jgi:hypothetical protein
MEDNKNADTTTIDDFINITERTLNLLYQKILNNSVMPRLSKATTEAVLVGIAKNIDSLEAKSNEEAFKLYMEVRNDDLFSVENLKEGLAQKDKVITRLNKAIEILSN